MRQGSLLIESIVAISISVVGLLGVLGLLSRSLAINQEVSQKFVANYLAAEGIEVVKSLIDKNYADGRPWNQGLDDGSYELSFDSLSLGLVTGDPLLFDAATGVYSYQVGGVTPFVRTVSISSTDRSGDGRPDELKVNSEVTWLSRGATNIVNLEDHFFDWR